MNNVETNVDIWAILSTEDGPREEGSTPSQRGSSFEDPSHLQRRAPRPPGSYLFPRFDGTDEQEEEEKMA